MLANVVDHLTRNQIPQRTIIIVIWKYGLNYIVATNSV